MLKLSHFSGQSELGPTAVPLFGPADSEFEKHASATLLGEVNRYISNLTPDQNSQYVLVNAMGAGEYYGSNINGDHFPEAGLIHRPDDWQENPAVDSVKAKDWPYGYPTFYQAYPFCFPAETSVVMADRTRRPINEVCEGDLVATEVGAARVASVKSRLYRGHGIELKMRGEYEPLTSTADHPLLVYRREQLHCRHKYCRLTDQEGNRRHVDECREFRDPVGDPEWVRADTVLPGDYLVLSPPKCGEEMVAPELAELVGWVASEGYLSKDGYALQFSFSENNNADIQAVQSCLEANGAHVTVTPRPRQGVVMLTASSKKLAAQVAEYVEGVKADKRLLGGVLRWSKEALLRLLGAYISGDGHVPATGRNKGQLRIRSSSPQMLRVLADIVRAVGVEATIQWDHPAGTMTSPTNGKTYPANGSGCVAVAAGWAEPLLKHSRKNFSFKPLKNCRKERLGDRVLVQVTEREDLLLDEAVYCLSVPGPEHYFANEVVVHNSHHKNKDASRAYGEVELAAWNPNMKRVELVVRVDKDKCTQFGGTGIWDKLRAGQYPDVSMGCLPAGSLITMADGVQKPIELVCKNDRVLSHTGARRRVTDTMLYPHEGSIFRLNVYGFRRELVLTGNHPLWLVDGEQLRCEPSSADVNKGRKQRHCPPFVKAGSKGCAGCDIVPAYEFEWRRTDGAQVGDYLAFPVPRQQDDTVQSKYLARFLGYYLAEGHVGNYNARPLEQITFSLGYEERDLAMEIEELARRLGADVMWHYEQPEQGARYFSVVSKDLADKCLRWCGSGAKNKALSPEVLYMSPSILLEFLGAYLNGDGGTYQGSAYFSTASEVLSHQLFIALARCGMIASVNRNDHKPSERSVVKKETTEYQVWVGTDFSWKLANYTSKPVRRSKKVRGQRFFYEKNGTVFLMAPILEIVEEEYDDAVYNFSVDGEESYVAEGLAVHNSKVPYDTCFPAGTLIRTGDRQKPIEEVQVGDFVLSHTGVYRAVHQTMRREAEGLVRITASGLPRVEATDNHPFLVLRREQARTCKGSANGNRLRHSFSDSATCKRCGKTPEFELVWAAAETLKPGDYLATPVSSKFVAEHDVTPAQARLLGYYLGDGYIIQQRTGKKKDGDYRDMGFAFSVGTTEAEHLRRLLHTVVEVGAANEPNVYDAGCDRKAYIVSVYDQSLAAWLQKWGGRTSHGKRLTEETFHWSRDAKLELVAGYIDTDGSFDEKGQVRIASVNRGLLLDVQRLLLSENITATVCLAGTSSGLSGSSECWYLVLSATQGQKFLGRSTKIRPVEVGWESPQSFFWGDYWLTPVKAIEELDEVVEVFNLSVDKDESYVAEGRAVHNCSICLDWDQYHKALQTYDPKKHKHPGIAALAYHKNVKAIQGLSVTRKDYCTHARTMMNRIFPDGRKVFVYNDFPRFFDISFVFIGADKTAKVMLFIYQGGQVYSSKPSAEVANDLGVKEASREDFLLEKAASVSEEILKSAFMGKGAKDKKGEIEKRIIPSQFAGKAVPLLTRNEPDLPPEVLKLMGRLPLESTLATTAAMGIVLKPSEFQRVTLQQLGKGKMADELEDEGKVFPKTDEEEEVRMGPRDFLPSLAKLLLPFLAHRSALGPIIEQRAVAPQKPDEGKKEASSHNTALLRKISSAYNGYRSKAMEVLASSSQLLHSVEPTSGELHKLGSAQLEDLFTPLTVKYFQDAYFNELPFGDIACAVVQNRSHQADTPAWRGVSPQ